MGKILSAFVPKTPKVPKIEPLPAPKAVEVAPVKEVEDESKKAKAQRVALYQTEGGAQGQEILSGGVGGRSTLLGN